MELLGTVSVDCKCGLRHTGYNSDEYCVLDAEENTCTGILWDTMATEIEFKEGFNSLGRILFLIFSPGPLRVGLGPGEKFFWAIQ